MDIPLEISFQNIDPSEFVEARIRERVDKLQRYYDRINSCRVAVRLPHKQHQKGNIFHVRIEIRVPGTELVISRDPGDINAHQDVYVAIRDAFDAAEGRFEDIAEGATVELAMIQGESPIGPQATTVRPIRPTQYIP
jgi:ribosomal subunit interface protein